MNLKNLLFKLRIVISTLGLLSALNLYAEKSARHALEADVASKLGELTAEDVQDLKESIDTLTANLTLADESELTAAYIEDLEARIDELEPAVGDYKISAESGDHDGWLLCDGREEDKADYPELFTAITNSFSKNKDKFQLPDAKGRVLGIIGQGKDDQDKDLTPRLAGHNPGYETHILTSQEIPGHSHETAPHDHGARYVHLDVDDSSYSDIVEHIRALGGVIVPFPTDFSIIAGQVNPPKVLHAVTQPSITHTQEAENADNGQEHNIMQPTLFLGNLFIYAGENAPMRDN